MSLGGGSGGGRNISPLTVPMAGTGGSGSSGSNTPDDDKPHLIPPLPRLVATSGPTAPHTSYQPRTLPLTQSASVGSIPTASTPAGTSLKRPTLLDQRLPSDAPSSTSGIDSLDTTMQMDRAMAQLVSLLKDDDSDSDDNILVEGEGTPNCFTAGLLLFTHCVSLNIPQKSTTRSPENVKTQKLSLHYHPPPWQPQQSAKPPVHPLYALNHHHILLRQPPLQLPRQSKFNRSLLIVATGLVLHLVPPHQAFHRYERENETMSITMHPHKANVPVLPGTNLSQGTVAQLLLLPRAKWLLHIDGALLPPPPPQALLTLPPLPQQGLPVPHLGLNGGKGRKTELTMPTMLLVSENVSGI